MSLQMQSNNANSVVRKGSLSLGNNANNSSQAKTKQQKIIDCIDDQSKKNGKEKKFTNGSGNSHKNNEKNGRKTEEKEKEKVDKNNDKEKSAVVKKPSSSENNQEKKKEEKVKSNDVKKGSTSNDAPKKEENSKPSTPTITSKKQSKVESTTNKEEKKSNEETVKVEPTTTEKQPKASPAKTALAKEDKKQEEEPMAVEVSTTTITVPAEPQTVTEAPKIDSPKKVVLEKKQTPEPIMFAEKDQLVSSTPAKPSELQKKISKSSDNVNAKVLEEIKTYPLDRSSCPTSYRNISGRRSLRPMKEYVFQHTNSSLRESYRKINTELDVGNISNNTSLNVTVGSEAPSNWSFSFLGRSRKRDRTPTHMDTSEAGVDLDTSPTSPKRARFDFSGFVGILSSPVTMLRERLARTKIQNTPHKLRTSEEDINDVANVSSASIEEVQKPENPEPPTEEIQIDVDIDALKKQDKENKDENIEEDQPSIGEDALDEGEGKTEVRETETKKKGCVLM